MLRPHGLVHRADHHHQQEGGDTLRDDRPPELQGPEGGGGVRLRWGQQWWSASLSGTAVGEGGRY